MTTRGQPRRQPPERPLRDGQPAILLVDDGALVRGLFADILQKAGYHVEQASDGFEAQAIIGQCRPFDLLLTDFRMPGMNGAELAVWFHERWPRASVMVISADPHHLGIARALAPFADCILKTSHPDELLATVASALARSQPPEEP